MSIKDLLYAPIFLLFSAFLLNLARNSFTTAATRKYFFPAVYLKFLGALALGLIYEFYYRGGDTLNYFHQAQVLNDAFWDSPSKWWQLLMSNGDPLYDLSEYTSRIYWYQSPTEYTVIKFAGFFSVFSGNSYLLIAFWFALISFSGLWAMYLAMIDLYPQMTKEFAIGIFFLPSVFFWGSGLMKDTLCMAGMGWLFYSFYYIFIKRKKIFVSLIILFLASYLTISVKPYIFYAFTPAAGLWVFNQYSVNLNKYLRYFILIIIGVMSLFLMTLVVNLEAIAQETKIQSDWIQYASNISGGSTYSIGEQDGTFSGMIKLFIPAVNVSLFRPYLFEVRNPVMLLSALEASFFMFFTIYMIFKIGIRTFIQTVIKNPLVNFSMIFSIIFAFFIGVSSYNFGALVRYKIPLMPFYIIGIYITYAIYQKKIKT